MQRRQDPEKEFFEIFETDEEVEQRVEAQKRLGIYGLEHDEFAAKVAIALRNRFQARVAAINFFNESKQVFVGLAGDDDALAAINSFGNQMDKFDGWCPQTMSRRVAHPIPDVLGTPRMEPGPLIDKPIYARGYMGTPLLDGNGTPFGTACVVMGEATNWVKQDVIDINKAGHDVVQNLHHRQGLLPPT